MIRKFYFFIMQFFVRRYLYNHVRKKSKYKPNIVGYIYDDVTKYIYNYGHHEKDYQENSIKFILDNYLINFDTLIDCGANIGTTAINLQKYYKNIYCIEPLSDTFKLLEINTKHYSNINLIRVLLSNVKKEQTISWGDEYICGAKINGKFKYSETVQSQTLDNLFLDQKFEHLCIKYDLEGHEYEALQGSSALIKRYSPIIFIEINNAEIQNNSSKSFNFLKELGYSFYNYEKNYHLKLPLINRLPIFNRYQIKKINSLASKNLYGRYKFLICIPKK